MDLSLNTDQANRTKTRTVPNLTKFTFSRGTVSSDQPELKQHELNTEVCVIQTNDALVAPLLRLKDNNCHVDETERVLKKHQKFSELIILYEKKGLHRKGELNETKYMLGLYVSDAT